MSRSYQTGFDSGRSPINNSPASATSTLSPDAFKTNINRARSKRWVEASKVDYDSLWGDDGDDGHDDDDGRHGDGCDEQQGVPMPAAPAPAPYTASTSRSPAAAAPAPNRFPQRQASLSRYAPAEHGLLPEGMRLPPPPSEIDMAFPPPPSDMRLPPPPSEIDMAFPPPPSDMRLPPTPSEIGERESMRPVHVRHTPALPLPPLYMQSQSPQPRSYRDAPTIHASPPSIDPVHPQQPREGLNKRLSIRKPVPTGNSPSTSPLALTSSPQPPVAYTAGVPSLPDLRGEQHDMRDPGQHGQSPSLSNVDKPALPQPPPEAASLGTISEHGSAVSGRSFPVEQAAVLAKSWERSPTYDDYEHDCPMPQGTPDHEPPSSLYYQPKPMERSPASLPPLIPPHPQQPSSFSASPVPTSPTSPTSPAKPKIMRPSDIYKRHQEEQMWRPSVDFPAGSVGSHAKPSRDEQGPPTGGEPVRSLRASDAAFAPPPLHTRVSQEDIHRRSSSRQRREQGSSQTSTASPSSPARPRSRSGASHPSSPTQPPAIPLPSDPLQCVSDSGGSSPSSPLARSESIHSPSPHPPPVVPLPDTLTPTTLGPQTTSWSRPRSRSGSAARSEHAPSPHLPPANSLPIQPSQESLGKPEEEKEAKDTLPGSSPSRDDIRADSASPTNSSDYVDRAEGEKKVKDTVPEAVPLVGDIKAYYAPAKDSGDHLDETEEERAKDTALGASPVASPVADDVKATPAETNDHQDNFAPSTGQLRFPLTTTIPLAHGNGDPDRDCFQTMVDRAFIRQDTLVSTPHSETPPAAISPILPPPPVSPRDDGDDDLTPPSATSPTISVQRDIMSPAEKDLAPVETLSIHVRNPSPESMRKSSKRLSVALLPVQTEAIYGELAEVTPVSTTDDTPGFGKSDELDHFIGELERAQTPDPRSPSITSTPSEHAVAYSLSSPGQDRSHLSVSSRSPSIDPVSLGDVEERPQSSGQDHNHLSVSHSPRNSPISFEEVDERPQSSGKDRVHLNASRSPSIKPALLSEAEEPLQTSGLVQRHSDTSRSPSIAPTLPEEAENHPQSSGQVQDYLSAPRSPSIASTPPGEEATLPLSSAQLDDYLGAPTSVEATNMRESIGVLSYDLYWQDGNDDPAGGAPLPVPPKSPLRAVAAEGHPPMSHLPRSEVPEVTLHSEFKVPKKSSPSLTIPTPQETNSVMTAEPTTPTSIVDQALLELVSTGKRFLDRQDTVIVPRENTRQEYDDSPSQSSPIRLESERTALTKHLGPESEGIEAIGGPIIEKRPMTDEVNSPAENDYTKELLKQFSRPQTLMLKQTMPSGVVMMPPMPPAPGGKSPAEESAPEVISFDKDYGEGIEVLDDAEMLCRFEDRNRPPSDKTVTAKAPTTVIEDTGVITALESPEERTRAYDALRGHIRNSSNPLAEWITYQMEHNNGEELLNSEIVSIKPGLAPRKSKSRIGGLGHFPSRSGDGGSRHDEGTAYRAEETLEKMGRGAMRLGEKAGGRVGGWVKRVGKKGSSNKESTSETADHQTRDVNSIESDTPIGGRTRNASIGSHASIAVRQGNASTGAQHTVPLGAASPSSMGHPPPLPHIQTQFQPRASTTATPTPQPGPSLHSVEGTRQSTPSAHHQPSGAGSKSPSPHSGKPLSAGPSYSPFPVRMDSLSSVITARGVPLPLSGENSPAVAAPPPPAPATTAVADELKEDPDSDDDEIYSVPKQPEVEAREQKPVPPANQAAPQIPESHALNDGSDSSDDGLFSAPKRPLRTESAVQDQKSTAEVRQSTPSVPRPIPPIPHSMTRPAVSRLQGQGPENIATPPLPQQQDDSRLSVMAVPPSPNSESQQSHSQPNPQPNQQGPTVVEQSPQSLPVAHPQGYPPQLGQQILGHGDQRRIPQDSHVSGLQDPHVARPQQPSESLPSPHTQVQQQQCQQPPLQGQGQNPAPPQAPYGHPLPPSSRGSTLARTVSDNSGHPPGSSSSNSEKKPKRTSFLGGLGDRLDSMGRSITAVSQQQPRPQQHAYPPQAQPHPQAHPQAHPQPYPQGQPQSRPQGPPQTYSPPVGDAPPQKLTKRGSFLTKLGGDKAKKQEKGVKPKGHKKMFSDIFSRTSPPNTSGGQSPTFGRLAKAGLVGGGSGGAQALVQPSSEPKIYDPKTGQYMSFDQVAPRSASAHSYGAPVPPPQESRPSIGGYSQQSGYQPQPATYPMGVPQQQLGPQQQMHSPYSPAMARQQSVSTVSPPPPSPGQQQLQRIQQNMAYPQQQAGREETQPNPPRTPYRQPSQMAHGGQVQGMPPPPSPGNYQYQLQGPPRAHPQHHQYGAPPPSPNQQQQYSQSPYQQTPYAASPTHPHPGYQQQQPSYQQQYQPSSGAPQLPPLPPGLTRQSTQSSLYNAVLAHRGSIVDRRAGNTPPPQPQQYSPARFPQQSSPQLGRVGTAVSELSGNESAYPQPLQQPSAYPPPPPQQHQDQQQQQQQYYAYTPQPPSVRRTSGGYAGYTSPVVPLPPAATDTSCHPPAPLPQQELLQRKQSVVSNASASGYTAPTLPQQPLTPVQASLPPQRAQSAASTTTNVSGLSSAPGISRQGTHHSSLAYGASSMNVSPDAGTTPANNGANTPTLAPPTVVASAPDVATANMGQSSVGSPANSVVCEPAQASDRGSVHSSVLPAEDAPVATVVAVVESDEVDLAEAKEQVQDAKDVQDEEETNDNGNGVEVEDVQDIQKTQDIQRTQDIQDDKQDGQVKEDAQDEQEVQVTKVDEVVAEEEVNEVQPQKTEQEQPAEETLVAGKQPEAGGTEQSPTTQAAEPKTAIVEEKIAVHYEGDDGKEVVSNGHHRGQSGASGDGYSMSSSAYPGSWEPAYYGWGS